MIWLNLIENWYWYWSWLDLILIEWGFDFDLIKTLWYCEQVNVRFELKSNVHDNAPMSKVEDVMQSLIRRRCELNLESLIMDEDLDELN